MHKGNWDGIQILDSSYAKEATSVVDLLDENGNKIQPIFQMDTDTNIRSYRVYINGGNTKAIDKDIFCY